MIMKEVKEGEQIDTPKKETKLSVEHYLTSKYDFRWNEFTGRTEIKKKNKNWQPVTDYIENSLYRELTNEDYQIGTSKVHTLLNSDFVYKFDPLKYYINTLPEWDLNDHIGKLAKTVKTDDNELFEDCLKRWLVAMIACGINKDKINQQCLILSGGQGIGKSTWIRNLLPIELRQYHYSGMINPNSKDTLVLLAEKLIIDMDELSSLSRKGNNEVKEIITKNKIDIRRPYGKNVEELPRRSSFIGSVNDSEFLTDTTGNRRFLPFTVSSIDYKQEIDYPQLYAQLKHLYKSGFKYWFDGIEIDTINKRNEKYVSKSPIEEAIIDVFALPENRLESQERMSSTQIVKYLQDEGYKFNLDSTSTIQVGKTMNKLKFDKVRTKYAVDIIPKGKRSMSDKTPDEVIEDAKMMFDISNYEKRISNQIP